MSKGRVSKMFEKPRDDGYAMIVVIGIISVLTVITFGGFAMSMQAMREADITQQESQGFQAASAAFDAAIARLQASGFRPTDFPMTFTPGQIGSGAATVTITGDEFEQTVTAVGMGRDGSTETLKARVHAMNIYGMNISYGAGFNTGASNGRGLRGNTSVFGPFYTYGSLIGGENIGNTATLGWGPLFVKEGTVRVDRARLYQMSAIFSDPAFPRPTDPDPSTRIVMSVPDLVIPEVAGQYLEDAFARARGESADDNQGDPSVRVHASNPAETPYPAALLATGARPMAYKVIDNNDILDGSRSVPFVIDVNTPTFGRPTDDFHWDNNTDTLTVWGTVFIDGPITFSGERINYVGNGTIVANGDVSLNTHFVPLGGLLTPTTGVRQGLENQDFRNDQVVGIATPGSIELGGSGGNQQNPEGFPSHAGAFFADGMINISARVHIVGSLIAHGIDLSATQGNINMDLRTSPNLGAVVSRGMPGHGMSTVSIGTWTRQ